ncbi:MAG: STAS domain-containing protein [Pseudonocardiaceae bacterium]
MTTARDPSDGPAGSPTPSARHTPAELLGLTVQRPAPGVCVVTVDGELDMLTAPLLEACIREQLAATPTHLVLDLQPTRFMGSSGLTCLLKARDLASQIPGLQLHLTGLATRAVARPLQVTGLLGLFDTYPTVGHALAALVYSAGKPSADPVPAPSDDRGGLRSVDVSTPRVLVVVWCCSVGATWTLELHELDRGDALGAIVDWVSSGVPVSQPVPDALARELLAERGLQLIHASRVHGTGSRHRIGYVCAPPN